MANFKTHLAGGVGVGLGVSAVSVFISGVNITQAFSLFIMGVTGGVLPDLDSDTGKPLASFMGAVSVLVPVLLFDTIDRNNRLSVEFMVSYFACSYFLINYLVCGVIKKLTVHRGIMHSIPFAVLAGELGYLLFASSGQTMAKTAGIAVFAGCITHLILDELNSVSFKLGFIPTLKKSFGSALKIKSDSRLTSMLVYCLIVGMGLLIMQGTHTSLMKNFAGPAAVNDFYRNFRGYLNG